MYVIEFQKPGLPHAHILLIFAADDKPITTEDIDSIVSAQLPHQNLLPELHDTVVSCMLHGPCGGEQRQCSLYGRWKMLQTIPEGIPRRNNHHGRQISGIQTTERRLVHYTWRPYLY